TAVPTYSPSTGANLSKSAQGSQLAAQLIHTSFLAGTRSYPQATYLLQKSPWFLLCSTRPTPIWVTSKKLCNRGRLSWFAERFDLFHRPRCTSEKAKAPTGGRGLSGNRTGLSLVSGFPEIGSSLMLKASRYQCGTSQRTMQRRVIHC